MAIKVIIFDFDGTIADSRDAFVNIVNRLAPTFGYQPVGTSELEELTNLSSEEIIKRAKICQLKIPFILRQIKKELNKEIGNLKPIYQIGNSLISLKQEGYQLGIITSNLKENVEIFLKNNQLDELFNFVCSGITLFGKNKVIDKFIKQNNLQPHEVIYVGDETRDITAAKKSKVRVIAVAWGFNSPEILAKFQPDFLLDNPQELVETAKKITANLSLTFLFISHIASRFV
jgi:phosphoglycolate phosphatase